jgi:hypothetical protein
MVFGGKQLNNINNYIQIPSNSYLGTVLFTLVTMFIIGIFIAGVVHLIKLAQHCLYSQGSQGYYEPFASLSAAEAYKKELSSRVPKLKQLNQVLDDSIDTFNDNVQDTCEVYAQVEDIYVGNNSSPASEDEYNLPKDELDRRLARRKKSAQKRFQEARMIYSTTVNTPVYECFENPKSQEPQSIPDLEDDLRAELEDLETKIQSVQVGTVGQKGDSLNALLKFNNKYIKKSLQEMGNEKARVLEGFGGLLPPSEYPSLHTVSGAALLKRADAAINKANAIYAGVTTQHKTVTQQKELVKEITKTTSRVESGNVSAGDIQA